VRVCFDIDGVLCSQVWSEYSDAQPNCAMIELLNRLFDRGDYIVLYTSRFMGRTKQNPQEAEQIGREFTTRQLAGWGVRYHELWMGKPRYDYVIDDRSVFYDADCSRIESFLEQRRAARQK
jgi:CMP-N,N'-diacetyllegionaminic acid synthase